MEGFKTYSGYKVGASHIAKNMGCEDYAATFENEKVSIAVISDGHGDRKCFRSAQGAHIACDVSIDCVRRMIESSENACDSLIKSPDRIITELEREIIRKWNKGVDNDLNLHPITDEELEGFSEDTVEAIRSGHSLNKIYGCTLIMCVVIEGFWFGIHIGDGKCVVSMNNGLYSQPIPWDEEGCVGNRSTSICNSNSFAGFRYYYGNDVPTGLFVASDGVDESFDESGLNRCYYTLGYWVQTLQREELDQKMEELLSQVTNNGSGDDVSIACILSGVNDIKKPYASSEQVAEKLKELIDNIKEKEEQFDSLSESKREVSESIEKLSYKIEDLKKTITDYENEITDKKQDLLNIDNNLQSVIIQLQKSVTQLPKAKETKERVDQYWRGNGVEIKDIEGLTYTPRYSEEYLGEVIEELDNPNNKNHSEELTESSSADVINTSGEKDNELTFKDSVDEEKTCVPKTLNAESNGILLDENRSETSTEEYQKSDEKNEDIRDESELKSQKNSFFGGLFGRKK